MGIQERKQREKEELRRKIIHTASHLVSQDGHENLTIRKLARAIEYSPRTIYLHFRDKEHLLHEIVEEGFRRTLEIRRRADRPAPGHTASAMQIIEERLRTHIESALSDPNFYRAVVTLLFEKNFEPGPAQREIIEQTRRDISSALHGSNAVDAREVEESGGPEGTDREEKISALSMIIFSTVRGFALALLKLEAQIDDRQKDKLVDTYIDFVKRGLS